MTTVCCKCQKTKTADGWLQTIQNGPVMLSHGYCPACYGETIKKIENHRRQQSGQS